MNHRNDHAEHQFDIWLDAFVAGMSTPASRAAFDSETSEVRDAARQFHGLAHGAERSLTLPPFASTWEDFMHAQPASPFPIAPSSIRRVADLVSAPPHSGSTPHRHRPSWDRAFSAALVVALVLATVTMVWRVVGNPFSGPGGESPPEPLRFAAFQDGGESELFEVAEVPDPGECTVEPLTVAKVMERVQKPQGYEARMATPGASTPTAFQKENEEFEGESLYDTPDQETVDAIAASQRQWLACHLAGDLFRVWALESGTMIQATIFSIYGPQFAPETLRADLERLAAGEDDTPFQTIATAEDAYLPMIVTSGWDTFYPEPQQGKVEIPVYWTSLDGSVAAIPSYLSESQYNDPAYETVRSSPNLPNRATYVVDYETKQWLLVSFDSGGRG